MPSKHCCKNMSFFLQEGKVGISYTNYERLYSIDLRHIDALQKIYYCPWCGSKLPKALDDKWLDDLKKLGFKDPNKQQIPEEFKTDEWWKKRGL